MKYLAFYILLYLLSTGNDASIFPNFNMLGGHNLTISEAESILGEPCIQMDASRILPKIVKINSKRIS